MMDRDALIHAAMRAFVVVIACLGAMLVGIFIGGESFGQYCGLVSAVATSAYIIASIFQPFI